MLHTRASTAPRASFEVSSKPGQVRQGRSISGTSLKNSHGLKEHHPDVRCRLRLWCPQQTFDLPPPKPSNFRLLEAPQMPFGFLCWFCLGCLYLHPFCQPVPTRSPGASANLGQSDPRCPTERIGERALHLMTPGDSIWRSTYLCKSTYLQRRHLGPTCFVPTSRVSFLTVPTWFGMWIHALSVITLSPATLSPALTLLRLSLGLDEVTSGFVDVYGPQLHNPSYRLGHMH